MPKSGRSARGGLRLKSPSLVFETPAGTSIAVIQSLSDLPDDVDYYMFYPLGVYGIAASCDVRGCPKTEGRRIKRFLEEGLLHRA